MSKYGALPSSVFALFDDAEAAGYTKVDHCKTHVQLKLQGRKVGGWNRQQGHWYVSQQIADATHPAPPKHGFCWMERAIPPHWRLKGGDGADAFRRVVGELMSVHI